MLALGTGLRRAGHDVVLAAAPNFSEDAQALGLEHVPVGRDVFRLIRDNPAEIHGPLRGARFLASHYRTEVTLQFDGLFALPPRFDAVVSAGAQVAAASLAEKWNVPYRYVAYFPELIPSAGHAPVFVPWLLPAVLNRSLWVLFRVAYDQFFAQAYNEERLRVGLPKIKNMLQLLGGAERCILAVDEALAPTPEDLKGQVDTVGSLHLDDDRPLPDDVERFLQSGPPPIYLGFGSMPDADPRQTALLLQRACREAGARALISSGWANLNGLEHGEEALLVGHLNHGKLFPRLAAIVHHGGAGTTAAATRAGTAQVLIPHSFDQYAWARRTVAAGVSPGHLTRARLSAERLTPLLKAAAFTPRYAEQARVLAQKVRAQDGVAGSIAVLESAVRQATTPLH
jgi:vancomycin aglycone glucosyltransferase